MPQDANTPTVEVTDDRPVRLDLACGQHPKAGFTGVDLFTGETRVDLLSFPWSWADGSVDEVHCSHFVEHIPMAYIDAENREHARAGEGRRDLFYAFFDEIYRILKPGGRVEIVIPYLRHNRAFQDPTHRRFIPEETFFYLNADFRKANALEHYGPVCDFLFAAGSPQKIVNQEESLRHHDVVGARVQTLWNVVTDLRVELVKR